MAITSIPDVTAAESPVVSVLGGMYFANPWFCHRDVLDVEPDDTASEYSSEVLK